MDAGIKRKIWRSSSISAFYVMIAGLSVIIITPIFILFSLSFMSDYEAYNEWPMPLLPSLSSQMKIEKSEQGVLISIYNKPDKEYNTLIDSADLDYIIRFLKRKTNSNLNKEEINEQIEKLNQNKVVYFDIQKDLFANFKLFFSLKREALPSLWNSIYTAILTMAIALVIGGMGGYAFARFKFIGKYRLKLSVLFVKMFPQVALAIPAAIILINLGLDDSPIGLSMMYAIVNIGITIWITASIFLGIPIEFEEAAQVFGTTKFGAFRKVTFPLALPGLTACAMYAFIGSWNEYAMAIILTEVNQTLPVVVFTFVLGSVGMDHLTAAASLVLTVPSIIFFFFIRKYITRMWSGVKV